MNSKKISDIDLINDNIKLYEIGGANDFAQ